MRGISDSIVVIEWNELDFSNVYLGNLDLTSLFRLGCRKGTIS